MMLFTLENARLILEGRKTQTRRLVKPGDVGLNGWRKFPDRASADDLVSGIWVVQRNGRDLWRATQNYAVQPGRTKAAIGRIRIAAIRRERLQEFRYLDAMAEGAISQEKLATVSLVVQVSLCRTAMRNLWDSINRKPGTRWADNPSVWMLTFEVVK